MSWKPLSRVIGKIHLLLVVLRRCFVISKRYAFLHPETMFNLFGITFPRRLGLLKDTPFEEVGRELLRKLICVHLDTAEDKFNCLVLMVRKLYALVSDSCCPDNPGFTWCIRKFSFPVSCFELFQGKNLRIICSLFKLPSLLISVVIRLKSLLPTGKNGYFRKFSAGSPQIWVAKWIFHQYR